MSLHQIVLTIPYAPKSPNTWLGKRFAKHVQVKAWERAIACAVLTSPSTQNTADHWTVIMPPTSSSPFKMPSSILVSAAMTKTRAAAFTKGCTTLIMEIETDEE